MNTQSTLESYDLAIGFDSGEITGFGIREQLRYLFDDSIPLGTRLETLITTSYSKHHFRERFFTMISSLGVAKKAITQEPIENRAGKSPENISLEDFMDELGKKREAEKMQRKYHFGAIINGHRTFEEDMRETLKGWYKGIGHAKGVEVVLQILLPLVVQMFEHVGEFSLYLLANKNLGRETAELENLDKLFRDSFQALCDVADKHNIEYRHAGDLEGLKEKMPNMYKYLPLLIKHTSGKTDPLIVNLCINYDNEMEEDVAWMKLFEEHELEQLKSMSREERQKLVAQKRYIPNPPDCALRTGGARRFSGFTHGNSTELVSVNKDFPLMTEQDFLRSFMSFVDEKRTFGL